MPKVALLPGWILEPKWNGIISNILGPKDALPEAWQPRIVNVTEIKKMEAFAFPLPLAWAEMMAAVLEP